MKAECTNDEGFVRSISIFFSICFVILASPLTVEAWFAGYILFDHIQWAPDSQSIVFEGSCRGDEGVDCPGPITLQYDFPTERLINLTPRIDWYMLSPSQKMARIC